MQTLLQISLILLTWVILPSLLAGAVFVVRYLRTQRKIRELDQKIFAYDSGAEKVTSTLRDVWLENLILFKGLSPRAFYRPKDVLIEMHDQYKAHFFVYSPPFPIFRKPLNGLIIQFRNYSMPSFMVSKEKPSAYWVESWSKLNLSSYQIGFPEDLYVYGDPNKERTVQDFWKEFSQLKDIFDVPKWETMWVSQNIVVLYFESNRSRLLDLKREMFGIDEQIASVILGSVSEPADAAAEIRVLKNERG